MDQVIRCVGRRGGVGKQRKLTCSHRVNHVRQQSRRFDYGVCNLSLGGCHTSARVMPNGVISADSIGSLARKVSLAIAFMSYVPQCIQRVTRQSDESCAAIARIRKRTEQD